MDATAISAFLRHGYACLWEKQIIEQLAKFDDEHLPNYPQVELPLIKLTSNAMHWQPNGNLNSFPKSLPAAHGDGTAEHTHRDNDVNTPGISNGLSKFRTVTSEPFATTDNTRTHEACSTLLMRPPTAVFMGRASTDVVTPINNMHTEPGYTSQVHNKPCIRGSSPTSQITNNDIIPEHADQSQSAISTRKNTLQTRYDDALPGAVVDTRGSVGVFSNSLQTQMGGIVPGSLSQVCSIQSPVNRRKVFETPNDICIQKNFVHIKSEDYDHKKYVCEDKMERSVDQGVHSENDINSPSCTYISETDTVHIHQLDTPSAWIPTTLCKNHEEKPRKYSLSDSKDSLCVPCCDDATSALVDTGLQIPQLTDTDVEQTVLALLDAQSLFRHIQPTDPDRDDIQWRRAKYVKDYDSRKILLDNTASISNEAFRDIYNRTGFQLDCRQKIVHECLIFLEQSITDIVEFAKHIPGFSSLKLCDQSRLLKDSKIESILLGFQKLRDEKHPDILSTPWGTDYSLDELCRIFSADDLCRCIRLTDLMEKLKPSVSELALIRAISITASDRCVLEDSVSVDKIHLHLVGCLIHILQEGSKSHKTCSRFGQIINIVILLRDMTELNSRLLVQICAEWPVVAKHDLVKEFYS